MNDKTEIIFGRLLEATETLKKGQCGIRAELVELRTSIQQRKTDVDRRCSARLKECLEHFAQLDVTGAIQSKETAHISWKLAMVGAIALIIFSWALNRF